MAVEGPIKLTPATRALLLEAAREFLPYDDQAFHARISPRTYRKWRRRARAGEEPYASLMAEVYHAEVQAQRELRGVIRDTALGERTLNEDGTLGEWIRKPNWLPAAWALERRKPRQYSTNPTIRLSVGEHDDPEGDNPQTSAESRKSRILEAFARTHPTPQDDPDEAEDAA